MLRLTQLKHYFKYGWREERKSSKVFDLDVFLKENPEYEKKNESIIISIRKK